VPYSGSPFSGPPSSGPSYGAPYGAVPPPPKRGQLPLILGIVAALLFITSGIMTGLYITKSGDLSDTQKRMTEQVSQRDDTIAAKTTEADQLKRDLTAANEKLSQTERDLTGTQNAKEQTEKEKAIIADCLNKVNAFITALANGDTAAAQRAAQATEAPCNEARKFL
jgi:chromosome segregation ATPase